MVTQNYDGEVEGLITADCWWAGHLCRCRFLRWPIGNPLKHSQNVRLFESEPTVQRLWIKYGAHLAEQSRLTGLFLLKMFWQKAHAFSQGMNARDLN